MRVVKGLISRPGGREESDPEVPAERDMTVRVTPFVSSDPAEFDQSGPVGE